MCNYSSPITENVQLLESHYKPVRNAKNLIRVKPPPAPYTLKENIVCYPSGWKEIRIYLRTNVSNPR